MVRIVFDGLFPTRHLWLGISLPSGRVPAR